MSDDFESLEAAVNALRELGSMDWSGWSIGTIVAIQKLAEKTIDAAAAIRLSAKRDLAKCLAEAGISARDLSEGQRLAEIPDEMFARIERGEIKTRPVLKKIAIAASLKRLDDENKRSAP